MRTKVVTLPTGQRVKFIHRDDMKKVKRNKASFPSTTLSTTASCSPLPVDDSGDATCPCPMDGNDSEGDCGPCMAAHTNGIRTYGQGKPGFTILQAPVAALESQYQTVSGGDNGTTEDMLVGQSGGPGGSSGPGIWLTGIAGDPKAVIVDHLDIDVSDVALTQYCCDWFYGVCMAWSVPDAFLSGWSSGSSWLSAMTPNPENGHFTPFNDVDANSNYRMWTWGGWDWVSQSFVMSVQPECFITLSPLQFNAQGYDSHGRHVSDVGAAWVSIGGNSSIVSSMVSQFPPKSAPPTPAPPTPTGNPVPFVNPPVGPIGPTK